MPSSVSSLKRTIGNQKCVISRLMRENDLRREESERVRQNAQKANDDVALLRANLSNMEKTFREVAAQKGELEDKLKATNKVLEETLAVVAKQTGKMTELRIKLHLLAPGQDIDGDVQAITSHHWTIHVPVEGRTSRQAKMIKIENQEQKQP